MNVCLSARNVQKSYGDATALSNISLDLYQGEIVALLGPNGAGKTTLIKILATLLSKDQGEVEIFGRNLDTQEQEIRHLFGYVGQDTERSAYARLTVLENLEFFGAMRGMNRNQVRKQTEKLAAYFDFEKSLNKMFMKLSGGQKQTAVIMRSLLHDPPLVYLDEPTKGLDPIVASKMRAFLQQYVAEEDKTLLLTTHILSDAEELADRVAFIAKGQIERVDTVGALKAELPAKEYVELERAALPDATKQRILNLDEVLVESTKDPAWVSFGVDDLLSGTEVIIGVLREDEVRPKLQHRTATLEDVFIRYAGALEDNFG